METTVAKRDWHCPSSYGTAQYNGNQHLFKLLVEYEQRRMLSCIVDGIGSFKYVCVDRMTIRMYPRYDCLTVWLSPSADCDPRPSNLVEPTAGGTLTHRASQTFG